MLTKDEKEKYEYLNNKIELITKEYPDTLKNEQAKEKKKPRRSLSP